MPEVQALETSGRVEEYDALTQGVALVDRSEVGRLRVSGEDAVDLLERLSTNALTELRAGDGAATVLTSNKGRIVDLLLVLRRDGHLMVLTGAGNQGKVAEWIDFYTIVEDVAVKDDTGDTAMIGVVGPGSPSLVEAATDQPAAEMALYESLTATLGGFEALVVRTDSLGLPGYDLILPAGGRGRAMDALLAADYATAPVEVALGTFEALRIERGVPGFGHELAEDFNPLEAGLIDVISFTKGCYVGQEVVARLNTYDKVQKRLMGMRWEGGHGREAGAKLTLDGKQVGVVTSAATSSSTGGGVGLGYVRLAHAEAGAVLSGECEAFSVVLVEPAVTP
jgi:folate-binding protein YgfZ